MDILVNHTLHSDEKPNTALKIIEIILEVTDSIMFVSSLLQIFIVILVLFFVLIFVRDTFNYLWTARISLGLFIITWQVKQKIKIKKKQDCHYFWFRLFLVTFR